MKVVTRFAPTLSGRLHLGHLVNVLYNYIYAKQNNGTFFLRLDGIKLTGSRVSLQNYFVEDLKAFGIIPDFIVKQSDRKELYRSRMQELLKRDDVYFCDCSAMDITRRASEGSNVKIMSRDEKYPAPSAIIQIKVLNESKQNLISGVSTRPAKVFANLSTVHDPISHVLDFEPRRFWQPYDVGYFGTETPIIRIAFKERTFVQHVSITFKDYPWREWKVLADKKEVARIIKTNKFCYHPASGDFPYASEFKDSVSFAPVECDELLLIPVKYMRTVRREYCYDGFCRNRNLNLNLDTPETVVRTVSALHLSDTVLWIYGVADLALTSAIDDQEFRVTHCFRGYDIEPFTLLEKEAAKLINFVPNNIMHGEILDQAYYKFSKFRESTPAIEYLKRQGPNWMLTYLAQRAGLISDEKRIRTLAQLVKEAELNTEKIRKHIIIDELILRR